MKMNKTLIVFLAPSGLGKTTCGEYLKKTYSAEIIKLATPLYEIQKDIYKKVGLSINSQDGELLQFLGHKIQTIKPSYLFDEFYKKYQLSKSELIINDDCRPHNYEYLQKLGAVFIKISGPNRDRPDDVSHHLSTHPVEWQQMIPYDYEIHNTEDLPFLYEQLDNLMRIICG